MPAVYSDGNLILALKKPWLYRSEDLNPEPVDIETKKYNHQTLFRIRIHETKYTYFFLSAKKKIHVFSYSLCSLIWVYMHEKKDKYYMNWPVYWLRTRLTL